LGRLTEAWGASVHVFFYVLYACHAPNSKKEKKKRKEKTKSVNYTVRRRLTNLDGLTLTCSERNKQEAPLLCKLTTKQDRFFILVILNDDWGVDRELFGLWRRRGLHGSAKDSGARGDFGGFV
jgi:hypothetical protein